MSTTHLRIQLALIDQLTEEKRHDEAIDKIANLITALMKLREDIWRECHVSGEVKA